MLTPILTAATAVLSSLLTLAGVWLTIRQRDTAEDRDDARDDATTIDARWQAMLDNQRRDFEAVLTPIRAELAELRTEVAALRIVRRVKDAAVAHIADLRAWIARTLPGATPPPLPALLENEV